MRKTMIVLLLALGIGRAGDVTPYAYNDMACMSAFQYDGFACAFIKEAVNLITELDRIAELDVNKIGKDKKYNILYEMMGEKIFNLCVYYKNMNAFNKQYMDTYKVKSKRTGELQLVMDSEDAIKYCYEAHPGVAYVRDMKQAIKESKK